MAGAVVAPGSWLRNAGSDLEFEGEDLRGLEILVDQLGAGRVFRGLMRAGSCW